MKIMTLTIQYYEAGDTEVSLHATRRSADEHLADWVISHWDAGEIGRDWDAYEYTERTEMIRAFFDTFVDDYGYDIQSNEVLGPMYGAKPEAAPLEPDEIFLDPTEIKATIRALKCVRMTEVGTATGLGNRGHCQKVVHNIIKKLKS